MAIERITVVLETEEAEALRSAARADLRRPQEQARYLLRAQLLGKTADKPLTSPTNGKRAAEAVQAHGALTE